MNSGSTVAAAAAAATSSSSAAFGDDHRYEWVSNDNHGGFSSAFIDSTHNISGSSNTTTTTNNNNNGSNSRVKPIRRRSRVSKKTPITLLNADAASFRSLVQQFTGCPNPPPSSSISFDHSADQTAALQAHGPLNLNFQLGTVQPTSNNRRPSTVLLMQDEQRRSYSPDYHVNPYDSHGAVSYDPSMLSGGDDRSSEMMTTASADQKDDRIMRMGSQNLDMVQELLMVDHHDDFGFFQ